jgi:hypothetical protein
MSKWFRTLLISSMVSILLAGGALAGPGKNTGENGEPDHPEIAYPVGRVDSSDTGLDTRGARSSTAQEETVRDDWKVLLKVYLKLAGLFIIR